MPGHTPRYCLRCRYDLSHSTGPACPECGGLFDPYEDPVARLRQRRDRVALHFGMMCAICPFLLLGWCHLELGVVWLYHGGGPGWNNIMPLWWDLWAVPLRFALVLLMPVAFVDSVAAFIGLGTTTSDPSHADVRFWGLCVLPFITWPTSALIFWLDPLQACEWWFA